ncbi:MAG: alkaline phosphatase family protein [Candidatus Tectomicrobia bacterium]|nr:alkaline phosphatase family protein [Candidatus Tectomicrobia bacterium]
MPNKTSSSTKLLVIGVDAGTLDLIEPFAAEGGLPHISSLMARGAFGTARSTLPPSTYPAWTTFMTGVGPGRHGLMDFCLREPGRYAVRFASARDRRAATLWSRLSRAGKRVAVVGMPATHPPEPLNGCMISGFDSPLAYRWDPGFVLPRSYYREITRAVGPYRFSACREDHVDESWHDRAKEEIRGALEQQTRVAEYLLGREAWDCFAVVFGQTDTACHHFWMFHDPHSPRFPGRGSPEVARHRGFIREVYQRVDASIGRLLARTGPETAVLLVSDHGAGGTGSGVLYLNRWLAGEGWLAFRKEAPWDRLLGGLKGFGLKRLPRRWQQAALRRGGRRLAGKVESRLRFGGIDFSRTRAYSEEWNSFPGVWVNLRGREPEGVVEAGAYEGLREAIIRSAESLRDPRTGRKILRRALRREEAFSGPCAGRAPDVVLDPALEPGPTEGARGYAYSFLMSGGLTGEGGGTSWFRELRPEERAGARGRGMNGTHRPEGFFVFSGPGVRPGRRPERAALADFAPTLLAYLGVQPAAGLTAGMEGRILEEMFEASAIDAIPGKSPATAPPVEEIFEAGFPPAASGAGEPPWEMETARRLRELGYLE